MSDVVIGYAVNGHPRYASMLRRSIESMRRFAPEMRVLVSVFGDGADARAPRLAASLGVEARFLGAEPRVSPLLMKWVALEQFDVPRVLFLDADVVACAPVAPFVKRYAAHDFYARIETGTFPPLRSFSWSRMAKLALASEAKLVPVFNTGVMVFNRAPRELLAGRLPGFEALVAAFLEKRLSSPSPNEHLVEEVAASLVLGRTAFTWGTLSPSDAAFYAEVRARWSGLPRTTMLHVWSALYEEFVERTEGAAASRAFRALGGLPDRSYLAR